MNSETKNTIYLLIGPKGSGKSFIGALFERHFNIPFLRVESWIRDRRQDRAVDDPDFLREVFDIIQAGILQAVTEHDTFVFESTGLTSHFDRLVATLQSRCDVVTIRIACPLEECLARVQQRDASQQIPLSADEVRAVNNQVMQRNLFCRYTIDNDNKTEADLIREIKKLLAVASGRSA